MKRKIWLLTVLLTVLSLSCSKESSTDADKTTNSLGDGIVTIIATADVEPQVWKYSTTNADSTWFGESFDDSTWTEGSSGFGTSDAQGTTVNTTWDTSDIWLRKSFEMTELPQDPYINIFHDEDSKVYINGVEVFSATGYITSYETHAIDKTAFKVGTNVIAVHCSQTTGGQFIDVGLADRKIIVQDPSDDQTSAVASCSDGIQNQDETGVDCGGSCTPCGDDLEEAIKTGNPALLTGYDKILQAGIDEATTIETKASQVLAQIYESNPVKYITWTVFSQFIIPLDYSKSIPLAMGNKGHSLAAMIEDDNNRYAGLGRQPFTDFKNSIGKTEFETPFKNVLAWLLKRENSAAGNAAKIAVTMPDSIYNDAETWLKTSFPNWEITKCKDMASLDSCYSGKDLIIIGANDGDGTEPATVKTALSKAIAEGSSVLYTHTDNRDGCCILGSQVGDTVLQMTGFAKLGTGNSWINDSADYPNYQDMLKANNPAKTIKDLLTRFKDKSFSVDMSVCASSNNCQTDTNENPKNDLKEQFSDTAESIRIKLNEYDKTNQNIFLLNIDRLSRILVLIGDKFREEVVFPMDKVETDNLTFFKSLFADYTVLNSRTYNPVQKDLGNFSRSDFSHVTPTNKDITMVSRKNFRSTGVYAIPGKVIKVKRTDTSEVKTYIFINSLRSGSTHEFGTDSNKVATYSRPKFLQSAWMEIGQGETISFSSPYGGPLQVGFDTNDQNVSFTFENVGEHAYWKSTADNAIFTQKIEANDYDWAEIATAGFEVHSTLKKMKESMTMDNYPWKTPEALAAATQKYIGNYPYTVAGFKGDGIAVAPEITDWANNKGYSIDTVSWVQHMNADQATCGYGCSGNPYDAYWAFVPVGHGDVHELGHGLESGRMRFVGWEVHATTNLYVYYTQGEYYKETGLDPVQLAMDFRKTFKDTFDKLNSGNGAGVWPDSWWEQQFIFYHQSAMSVQKMGKLANGWHLIGRLHVLEREFNRSLADTATWDAKKASLGFSSYTLDEAKAITNNDWMLIAMSFVSELDFRDYLLMWGLPYSQKAADQVASFAFTSVPRRYFVSTDIGVTSKDQYGTLLDKQYLDVNGSSSWPADYPE